MFPRRCRRPRSTVYSATTWASAACSLTDSLSAGAITEAGYDPPHAATSAFGAGADMILFASALTPAQTEQLTPANMDRSVNEIVAAIATAVGTGALPESRLDSAVGQVLTAKGVDLCAR
jgi:beta-glucosidase-like glycosyl hydrolase